MANLASLQEMERLRTGNFKTEKLDAAGDSGQQKKTKHKGSPQKIGDYKTDEFGVTKLTEEGTDSVTKAKVAAGGPGSGRKPEFTSNKNRGGLRSFHSTLTRSGYKFTGSRGTMKDQGMVTHVYQKGDPKSSGGRQESYIYERANGRHGLGNY